MYSFQKMKELYSNDLNFHHLRYFYAVAMEGGLRMAAEKLHVSQSSICTQIKQLEDVLGEKLFFTSGRVLRLTEFGQSIVQYAEDIFTLGVEITKSATTGLSGRRLHLHVGVIDALPKMLCYQLLRPAFQSEENRITCQEGKLGDLLSMLQQHRLDLVIADETASSGEMSRFFNHELSTCGVSFLGTKAFAKSLSGRFPRSLNQARALLPTQNCIMRRELEKWFFRHKIASKIIGEFEDPAFAKIAAAEGHGYIVAPSAVAADTAKRYGLEVLGSTEEIKTTIYAITAERKIMHPLIDLLLRKG